MKMLKRVLALMLSVLAVFVIGYLLFTCSRLADTQQEAAYEQTVSY